MKKFRVFFVAGLLMLAVLAGGLSVAKATVEFVDPVTFPGAPGNTFTAAVLTPVELPGTLDGPGGLVLPVGFTVGQKQFGGNGLKVTGLQPGESAKLCFDFPWYNFKWSGGVYQWNGTKWVALGTTVTPGVDGSNTWACAKTSENGTFALLMGYYGPPETLPISTVFID
jgi:hypothetical protein